MPPNGSGGIPTSTPCRSYSSRCKNSERNKLGPPLRARKTWGPASKVGPCTPGGAPARNPNWERDVKQQQTETDLPLTVDQLAAILWPEGDTE